jgi:hypothetical protein
VEGARALRDLAAEEGKPPVLEALAPVVVLLPEAGYVVVDELGRCRVVADDDEAGRGIDARLPPGLISLFVVAVERVGAVRSSGGKPLGSRFPDLPLPLRGILGPTRSRSLRNLGMARWSVCPLVSIVCRAWPRRPVS